MHDAIISIKPKHVEDIISGVKTVELRTRGMSLPVGSRLWVYATLPVGKVSVSVEVDFVEELAPEKMWDKFGKNICIPKEEFDSYTSGRCTVFAIGLRNIAPLTKGICLEEMRGYEENFQPPQFFSKLYPSRALYSAFYA